MHLIGLWVLAQVLIPVGAHSAVSRYALDPDHTTVRFEVRNVGIVKQCGVFNEVAGTLSFDPQGQEGSVDILVDARSVRTTNATVQIFLRGTSFLNVAHYSEIAYHAEHIVFVGEKPSKVDGKLTLLGVTRNVPLIVSDYKCQENIGSCVLEASATFRRSEFGMSHYMSLVSDEVRLDIQSVVREVLQ